MSTIVVGAGLSGLLVATRLARAGRRVTVLEPSRELGGRARTTVEAGFCVNLGPHALYRAGAAIRALRSVGIEPAGRRRCRRSRPTSMGSRRLPSGRSPTPRARC